MTFINTIELTTIESLLFIAGCVYIIVAGRPEWAAGIYLSMMGWTRTVEVGPIAHTWVLLATLTLSTVSFMLKNPRTSLLPYHSRGIVLWLLCWWSWTLLLISMSDFSNKITLYRSLLLGSIAPLPFILVFEFQWERIKGYALAYAGASLAGGWVSLGVLGISIDYLLRDPTLRSFGIIRLGIENYHWISYAFAISLLFISGFFIQTKHLIMKVFLVLCAANLAYFLFLTGSRQSLGAVFVALVFLFVWAQRKSIKNRINLILLLAALFGVGYYLLQIAPDLIVRAGGGTWWKQSSAQEATFFDAFNLFENRGKLWLEGLKAFIKSPIWGIYYNEYNLSHNYFIGALVNEGLIGIGFMLGFLVFIWKKILGFWNGSGNQDIDMWRTILISLLIFSFVHAQASGTNVSVWSIWWASAFLWRIHDAITTESRLKQRRQITFASSLRVEKDGVKTFN